MSQTFHIVKTVASVVMIVGGTAALFFAFNWALPLFVGGIAWAHIPE